MSNDHEPATMDPRYDGIYQRGGSTGPGPRGGSGAPRTTARELSGAASRSVEPRAHARSAPAPDAPPSGQARSSPAPEDPSSRAQSGSLPSHAEEQQIIREVGPSAPRNAGGRADRNPYDLWIWGSAAVLLALGIFLLMAPVLYAETAPILQSGAYYSPWFNYTMSAAPPLILVGVATAVTQLFVLSRRHARHHR